MQFFLFPHCICSSITFASLFSYCWNHLFKGHELPLLLQNLLASFSPLAKSARRIIWHLGVPFSELWTLYCNSLLTTCAVAFVSFTCFFTSSVSLFVVPRSLIWGFFCPLLVHSVYTFMTLFAITNADGTHIPVPRTDLFLTQQIFLYSF